MMNIYLISMGVLEQNDILRMLKNIHKCLHVNVQHKRDIGTCPKQILNSLIKEISLSCEYFFVSQPKITLLYKFTIVSGHVHQN